MKVKFLTELIETNSIFRITDIEFVKGSKGEVVKFGVYMTGLDKPIYAAHFLKELNEDERKKAIDDLTQMRKTLAIKWLEGLEEVEEIDYKVKDIKPNQ